MTLKDYVIGGAAVLALVVAVTGGSSEAPAVDYDGVVNAVTERLGAAPGPEHSNTEFFNQGITYGGGCFATSTSGTLTANTLAKNGCIAIAPAGAGQAALSLTLPATSTLSGVLPLGAGKCRDWFIDNSQVAVATTTTILKGNGWDLAGLDATGAGTGADVIDGLEYGRLTACRERNGDVIGYITEWIAAD